MSDGLIVLAAGLAIGGLGSAMLMYLKGLKWLVEYRLETLKASEFCDVSAFAAFLERSNSRAVKLKSPKLALLLPIGLGLTVVGSGMAAYANYVM